MAALLEVIGLAKQFGGVQAVKDLTFAVGEGEIVALIGPNGAGKTTAFSLIAGALRPDAGQIRFRGRPIVGLSPHAICALGVARTFQIVRPFPRLTVLRNVMVGALLRHPEVQDATAHARAVLDEVGLAGKRDQPAGGLTLAERKRLELARALATGPALLLLDEVMAGLNATEIERLIELIRAINRRGVTVLLIEHVMRAVMTVSGRVVVLSGGQLIAEGPPSRVANDPVVIEAYLGEPDSGDIAR
ncbi:MAG: ABC transporter ATP-binding protein [Candidatus Rokuibacteriota bacterium]|nr:MAG: ABC transporter ATP-binding protein [Candidatus Rokubacteria bacterium]